MMVKVYVGVDDELKINDSVFMKGREPVYIRKEEWENLPVTIGEGEQWLLTYINDKNKVIHQKVDSNNFILTPPGFTPWDEEDLNGDT